MANQPRHEHAQHQNRIHLQGFRQHSGLVDGVLVGRRVGLGSEVQMMAERHIVVFDQFKAPRQGLVVRHESTEALL